MKKIPLMKPLIPFMHELHPYFDRCKRENTYSNFGSNYKEAYDRLGIRTSRHMLPVTSGTAAIEIACRVMLPKGSRVMIPDFSHIGTYVGVRNANMTPILTAVDDKTWTTDLVRLSMNVRNFDAFVVVAPFGYAVDIEPYERFAALNKKTIIYDYAGAWGQFPDTPFPVCYSLHATKTFSTGEGGLVSFKHKSQHEDARVITNFGITSTGAIWADYGGNLKMDELRCAMICAHMRNYSRIEKRIARRANVLYEYLSELTSGAFINANSPSMAVIPGMRDISPEHIVGFACKFYYPLLTEMRHLENVEVFSKSSDHLSHCLALPIDVNLSEFNRVVEELKECRGY